MSAESTRIPHTVLYFLKVSPEANSKKCLNYGALNCGQEEEGGEGEFLSQTAFQAGVRRAVPGV